MALTLLDCVFIPVILRSRCIHRIYIYRRGSLLLSTFTNKASVYSALASSMTTTCPNAGERLTVQGRYYDPVRDIFIMIIYNQPAEQPVQSASSPAQSANPTAPALPGVPAANTHQSPPLPLLRGMFFPNFYAHDIPTPLQQSDFCPGFGGISIASFNSDTDPRNFCIPNDWDVVSAAKPFVDLLCSTQCAVGPYRMQPIQLLSEVLWGYKCYNSGGGVSWVLDFVLKASDKAPRSIRNASTEEEFNKICAYPPNFCHRYWKAVLRIGVRRESLGYSELVKALETLGDHMRFKPLVVESIFAAMTYRVIDGKYDG